MNIIILLGWINFSLFVCITSPLWIGFLNKHFFHAKSPKYLNFIKTLRRIHKPLGIVLAGMAFMHGYIALGFIPLLSGILTASIVWTIVVLGIIFFKTHKRPIFKWHRGLAMAAGCTLIVHIVFPNLLHLFI